MHDYKYTHRVYIQLLIKNLLQNPHFKKKGTRKKVYKYSNVRFYTVYYSASAHYPVENHG